jgi:thioredoxin
MNTPARTSPVAVDDGSFDDIVRSSELPVVVDFWAEWCPPCRALAPELDRLAAEHGDDVLVAKVDIDTNPELVERFAIASIPTLVFVREGEERDRLVGVASKSDLLAHVARLT